MKHKTALMTALSIVSVALAGTVAYAANLGILESTPPVGDVSAVVDLSTSVSPSPSFGADSEAVGYQIPDVGVVTLERNGEMLSLVSVDAEGWDAVERDGSDGVEVELRSGSRHLIFSAQVVDDAVAVDVVERSSAATTSTPTTGTSTPDPSVTTIPDGTSTSVATATSSTDHDDEDDDDRDEDDDHDDDHDDDRDENDDRDDDSDDDDHEEREDD